MKFIFVICIVLIGCYSADNNNLSSYDLSKRSSKDIEVDTLSKIYVPNPTYDFGKIKVGSKVKHVFYVVNRSKVPLIIYNAATSCGCTVASVPRKPILYNQTDSITAVFSSAETGMQNKVISLSTNTNDSPKSLTLIGNVVK
ncbi:DUF1573 domain-containing protein [Pedobacter polaris]|uniref:DUF1573 domain-containing protein n=1 Tax=Pedobacter polaris TaxID=2571273 RepID=A0A4U1CUU9_9SPHI|nr:DUF1573 domain-containing protein [Pedobacter polaris]